MCLQIALAVLFPPLAFLLDGQIVKAVVAFVLYAVALVLIFTGIGTLIGAPLALALIIWAVVSANNGRNAKRLREMERRITEGRS